MPDITLFQFESQEVRIVTIDNEPWFVAKDVLKAMGSTTKVTDLKALVEEDLGKEFVSNELLQTPGGKQKMLCLSEPALTLFVSRSRTDIGKAMNRWIHTEVLPSIRKEGKYELNPVPTLPSKAPDERVVDFTNALGTLASYGIDLVSSPRYQTLIRDFVADKILGATYALPGTESERWLGVAEKAEEMGYNAYLVGKCRSQLGRYVKSSADALGLECKQEHRFCHGTNRPIWIYRDCVELSTIVSEFMGAKTLSTHIEDDELIG